ncbi:MAG: hypothetical protein AAF389_09045 [Gemmatimonadota bacterium]
MPAAHRLASFVALTLGLALLLGCGTEPNPSSEELRLTILEVSDTANLGDGRDLFVRFAITGDASGVQTLKAYVVPGTGDGVVFGTEPSTLFDRTATEGTPGMSATFVDGSAIEEGVPLRIVLSAVTEGGVELFSPPSATVTLETTDIVRTIAQVNGGTGGMEWSPAGYVLMGDFGSQLGSGGTVGARVYRIDLDGRVSVFATGLGGASGNAIASDGSLFQSNIAASTISRITPSGQVSTFTASGVTNPVGIATSGDTLFVANCGGNSVSVVDPDGVAAPFAQSSLFNCPNGIARGGDDAFYVANFGDGNVLRVSRVGVVTLFAALPTNNLGHITAHEDVLYVVDRGGHRLVRLELDGTFETIAGTGRRGGRNGAAASATLSFPNDIAVSPDGRTLYFNDVDPSTPSGTFLSPSVIRSLSLDGS